MNARRSKRLVALGAVAALALVILILATQPAVTRGIVAKILGAATGTNIQIGSMTMHGGNAVLSNVTVSVRNERLAQIPRLDVAYNLRDLLPGSTHRFGLHAITVQNPRITVVHEPDGSYNLPKFGGGAPSKTPGTPFNMNVRVAGGTLAVIDRTRVDPASRHIEIAGVNINADVHTSDITRYVATMAYADGRALYPIRGGGVLDTPAGYTLHHWTAAHVPLPQIVNYALNNANIRMRAGFLDNLDARYYGGISASAYMRGARITMAGVPAPIENVHGPLDITSAGLTTQRLTATLAGAPVFVTGGIYDLTKPQFRLTVDTNSEIARLKLMAAAAAKLPVRGPVSLSMLVEGPVTAPLAMISLRSPQIDYGAMPMRDAAGTIAYDGKVVHILHVTLRYSSFSAGLRGRMALDGRHDALQAIANLSGSSNQVPYAASLLPGMNLQATLLASGDNLHDIQTQGILAGSGNGNLAGTFAISAAGAGNVALAYGNALQAKVSIDHPHNTIAALVHANGMTIHNDPAVSLPGLHVPALPNVSGTLTGDVFALQRARLLGLAGNIDLRDGSYDKITIADARASFGGVPGNINVSTLDAKGSFGTLNARGTIAGTNHIALQGHLRGSLRELASVAGNFPATGTVDAPIALVYDNGRALAQVQNAQFTGASIRGVAINSLSATIGTRGKNVNVYAARATVANGGSAVASGSMGSGGAKVALSVANLQIANLRGAGVPLSTGVANLGATASGPLTAPDVNGAVVFQDVHYGRYPIGGDTAFGYAGQTVLRDALIGMGPAFVAVDGTIRHGTYDLTASLRAADAHALVAMAQPKLAREYIEGSIDASVHIGGSGATPVLSGSFDAPEGSVHGLAFRNLHGTLDGTPQNFRIDNGSVLVDTTAVAFNAAIAGGNIAGGMTAPRADLSDFNDYFDTGDTLAGTGRIAATVAITGDSFASTGNVALNNVRYKRFDVGTTDASWRTHGQTLTARTNIGGNSGRLNVAGTVVVPAFESVGQLATTSSMNVRGTLRGLDLGTWLPLLGYNMPVTGQIDADATARGHYPDIDLGVNGSLVNGTVGRVRIEQAQVSLTALRGRGTIQQAVVRIANLTAQGSGTFGLHSNDPLQLAVHATSADLGKLMTTVTGKTYDMSGALDTNLAVTGTRVHPNLHDTFAFNALRYQKLTIPKIWGTLAGNQNNVTLQHGEIDLRRGKIVATGSMPLHAPLHAPVQMAINVDNVDFSDFEQALPHGYHLAGTMAGNMRVTGDVDDPHFYGNLALRNGYFVGPIDQNPISKIDSTLTFRGNSVAILALNAKVGGGTMTMSATANVPNFRRPADATFNSRIIAKGAQINSPQYFRGKIDADVTASRAPGAIPLIAGNITIPSARIPLTAFWNPKAPKTAPQAPIPLAFNLTATVGNDMRVQSPGVDVGAQGQVAITGTLASPKLSGTMQSTGGTISFLRRFTIQSADVTFDPANGIMPNVDAVATTTVSNPVAEIALHVTGLAPDHMQLTFDSSPGGYSQAQMMAMLAGVNNLNGTGGGLGGFSASNQIQGLAMGQLNTYFTQQLLEPLSASLGNALGLQNLQLTNDFTSGFGFNAVKAFGKHITAVFSETMGTPSRRSLSIEAHHGQSTAIALTMYSSDALPLFGYSQVSNMFGYNYSLNSANIQPQLGTNGFTLNYEHKF